MKKILGIMVMSLMTFVLLSVSAYASAGDVVGEVYPTDITATVNGSHIDSYCIGGKTAIAVDDFLYSGYAQYQYDESAKTVLLIP